MRPIEARYENGMLKPTERLALRQGERVAVVVMRHPDPKRWDLNRLGGSADEDERLAEAGLDEWSEGLDDEDRG